MFTLRLPWLKVRLPLPMFARLPPAKFARLPPAKFPRPAPAPLPPPRPPPPRASAPPATPPAPPPATAPPHKHQRRTCSFRRSRGDILTDAAQRGGRGDSLRSHEPDQRDWRYIKQRLVHRCGLTRWCLDGLSFQRETTSRRASASDQSLTARYEKACLRSWNV